MKVEDILRRVLAILASINIALATTSCSNGNEADAEIGNGKAEGEMATNAVVTVEASEKLTHAKQLEAECRRLVARAGRIKGWTWSVSCDLCNEICELPKDEALPLLDRLID